MITRLLRPRVVAFVLFPRRPVTALCAPMTSGPEEGPDRILSRDQFDHTLRYRFEEIKDRLYLLKDGTYGVWDEWSTEDWKA